MDLYFKTIIIPTAADNILDEEAVAEWLTSDDNRDIEGNIEEVNGPMLDMILNQAMLMAVLFTSKLDVW